MSKSYDTMTTDELRAELARLEDALCDLEDTHAFTFGKTSVHIGAERAQNMQLEYEEECTVHAEQIAAIKALLAQREAR